MAAEPEEKRILSLSFTVILPLSSESSICPAEIWPCSDCASCSYCELFASSLPFSSVSWVVSFFDAASFASRSVTFASSAAVLPVSSCSFLAAWLASSSFAAYRSLLTPQAIAAAAQSARNIGFLMLSSWGRGGGRRGRDAPCLGREARRRRLHPPSSLFWPYTQWGRRPRVERATPALRLRYGWSSVGTVAAK